jgi:hypothetical protein
MYQVIHAEMHWVIYKEQTVAVEWFGGRLGLATTRVRVLVLRIATKYNSEFSLSGLHFGRMLTTSYAY